MTKRGLLLWVVTVTLFSSAVPSWARSGGANPTTGPKAGSITALLPTAKIVRGAGKQAVTAEAKKGDQLVWNDLLRTEKGGRARVTLADQSILSLGSQAELRIVKHDAKSQQTSLQMAYGRVRAQVASITRDGGSFELRTPTAVAGVIGTDFGVDSSAVGGDTFICLAGAVQVANSDKSVAGSVQCTAGQTTTVQPGKPPTPPTPASLQQLQQLIEDTEPAIIASISPAAALPGTTFDTTIAGQNMGQVNSVTVSGSGVNATIKSASTSGVQIHVVVEQAASPGPRTITLAKQTGASSATVFTVLGTPTGDPKTAYIQTLQQLTQTGVAGLSGFLTGAQQTADQVSQQVTNANLNLPKPIDLTPFASALNQQYGSVQNALQSQNTTIQSAAQNANNQFQAAYDVAYQALLQRDPTGTPDTTFRNAVTSAFQDANNTLQAAITGAQSTLNGTVQSYGNSLNEIQQSWIQNINSAFVSELPGPNPKVNALERVVDLGAVASFDASSSSSSQGASIVSTSWTLCSPSYHPNGFGMPLDPSTQPCNGLSGFASTQSNFDIATCSLSPGSYYARLLLTDTNNKITPMDVKLTVLAPNYGTPSQTVRGLADAYGSLQLSQVLRFFDNASFPGYTQLSENLRQTLQNLSSMNINIRSSQDNITCNDATTRGDWQQNYSFRNSPNSVLTQDEQLSVRLRRVPGTGWLITDFQGDNGTVQGVPPGPQTTDQALPDLVVTTANLGTGPLDPMTSTFVVPGLRTVQATITNVGTADLISTMPVVLSILDASSKVLDTKTVNLPVPVAQNSTGLVLADLQIPQAADGTKLTLQVNVNPGCTQQEKACDGKNQQTYPLAVQNNVINLTNVTSSLTISPGGAAGIVGMDVSSTIYPVQVCSSLLNGIVITASNGGIKTGGTPTTPTCKNVTSAQTLTFTVAASLSAVPSLQNIVFTATNAGNPATGVPPATQTAQVPLTVAVADYVISNVMFVGHTSPYTGANAFQAGESAQLQVTVSNIGNVSPSGTITVTANCGTPSACPNPVTTSAAAPAAGASVVVSGPVLFNLPVASYSGNASLSSNVPAAIIGQPQLVPFDVVDFTLTTLPIGPQTAVVGRSFSLTAASVAPAGYPLPLSINYSGLPAGFAGNNLSIAGAPTAAGSSTVTISGTTHGVTHSASSTVGINVVPEIAPVQSSTPALIAGAPSQLLTLNVTGGIGTVTLTITLPAGITTTAALSQTPNGQGNVSWDLSANFTAATGGNLPVTIHASDSGFPSGNPTVTPAGNVNFIAHYSVNANANYVINPLITIVGHNSPFSGSNALQVGESTQIQATVTNTGNGSPSGNITVTADCGNPQVCSPALTATVAAPAAGSTVTVTLNTNTVTLPVATYNGTASVSTNIPGAVTSGSVPFVFDVVDFTVSAVVMSPAQNLPIGGTGTTAVLLNEQFPSGSAFNISVTPAPDANVTFLPTSQLGSANVSFTTNVSASATPGAANINVSVTNHGVTKSAPPIPVNYYTAQLVPQNLFSNDPANPLVVPVATGAGAPSRFPDIQLKMTGNFIGGAAPLTVTNPTCGTYSDNPFPTSAQPGDPAIDFPIYATAACATVSPITIQAAIPNTAPPTSQTVYTLYEVAKGLPQLQVVSAVPANGRDLTTQPWLAGEPLDWTVVVQNVGSGISTGNEPVVLSLNGAEVGRKSLGASIAVNGQGQVTVHTVAPDVPADASFGPSSSLSAHVILDTQGDLAPGTGDLFTPVTISNWKITVSGAGTTDNQPLALNLNTGVTSGAASVVIAPLSGGAFNPSLTLPLVVGSYSSGQLNPPSSSPASVTASAGSNVTVSIQNGQNPLPGFYFAQVIAQMKDGANVTTQRQATIHVQVTNFSTNSPANIALASDRNNIAGCVTGQGCGAPNASVQINGPLPETLTLTASVSFCSAGPCVGPVDVSFSDSFMTVTTPQVSTIQVTSPGNTLPIRVKAADNPDGSINTGAASVATSVSAIQAPFNGARTPTPDPVGNNQFTMAFNVGDIQISASPCVAVQPQNPTAVSVGVSLTALSGFNVNSVAWEWEDANHIPVSGTPLAFSQSSSTSTLSGTNYPLPAFTVTNPGAGIDGLQTYYFAVTASNSLATATKYFPVQFDLSQSQAFCPALGGARGGFGGHVIRGSWGKAGLMGASTAHPALKTGKLPDLRVSAADVSFTPSMPKNGDTVSVRFRISNVGDADAAVVPVALQVNGAIVATDTFAVAAGKTTLGALQWNNASAPAATRPAGVVMRASRLSRDPVAAAAPSITTPLQASVVIDPHHTISQKSTLAKSAALSHLTLHDGSVTAATLTATLNSQRVVFELGEGGCAGLRFNLGAGGCGSADVTVNVEDLAKGTYKLEATNGIADLGVSNSQYAGANFGPNALGQNGHTYAVQLAGGKVGLLTMNAVRNPDQLSEAAKRVFRGGPAAKVIRKLGDSSAAPEPVSAKPDSKVYFDIMYQGQ